MTKRSANFLLVLSASIIASAPIASVFVSAAGAADECLTKPKAGAPQGQHWYYRSDRITKRQCWYLRDKGDTSSQTAIPAPSETAPSSDRKSDIAKNETATNETLLNRATADAYAAWSSPENRLARSLQGPSAVQVPAVNAEPVEQEPSHDAPPPIEQSPVSSRWPDSTGVLSPVGERPATTSFAVASITPDEPADAASASPEVVAETSHTPAPSMSVSLQMLLLAAAGTLAFSGLTGGAIYFARARRWSNPDDAISHQAGWSPPDDAYRLYAPPGPRARAARSARRADARSTERLTSGLSENGQEIAHLLARFANQPEAER